MRAETITILAFLLLAACGGGNGSSHPDATMQTTDASQGGPGCGNGTCSPEETCQTCAADCGACAPGCGDGTCGAAESCASCSLDCVCPTAGIKLAGGAGLTLQDVSTDGAKVAYTDANRVLFAVNTSGTGTPVQLATSVDKARYKGGFLFVFHGVDSTGKVASSLDVLAVGGTTVLHSDSNVKVKSTTGSVNGQHYAYTRAASGNVDLVVDGLAAYSGADSIKAKFASTSAYLVASVTDSSSGTAVQSVEAFPTAGGAMITLLADGAGAAFAISPSGTQVVLGANDAAGSADLTVVPITGGTGTLLTTADDKNFTVLSDNATLVYTDAGAVRSIGLSGTGGKTLVASGAIDVADVSDAAVIYATAVDTVTGLETLRVARTSGAGDAALGTGAVAEGQTPGGTVAAARTSVAGVLGGDLVVVPISTLVGTTAGQKVTKSSFPDNNRIVFSDAIGTLSSGASSGASSAALQTLVAQFELVPDSAGSTTRGRVAYVIANGASAGLYVAAVP